MSAKMVVTGASGFVGRHFVRAAVANGYEVTAIGRIAKVQQVVAGVRWVWWDATAGAPLVEAVAEADVVCHLAAFIPRDYASAAYAADCLRINALGTARLLEAMSASADLIHVSTGQLYGRRGRLATESDVLNPALRAPYYLSSKLLAELYVDDFAERSSGTVTKLRLGSVFGPEMHGGAILQFLLKARANSPIEISSENKYAVDLVYVDDVVDVMLRAIDRRAVGTYNVGGGGAVRIRDAASESLAAAGAPASLLRLTDSPDDGDPGFDGLDISKASREFGYTPTPLRAALSRTLSEDPRLRIAQ